MAQLKLFKRPIISLKADGVAILIGDNRQLTPSGSQVDGIVRGRIARTLREEDFRVKAGNIMVFYSREMNFKKVFCAALFGSDRLASLREAAYSAVRAAKKKGVRKLALAFDPSNADEIQAIGEGALLATYRFERFKSKKESRDSLGTIIVCSAIGNSEPLKKAEIYFRAAQIVRDLVNEPAGSLRPPQLAERAEKTARESKLKCRIFEPAELQRMGATLFLSVGKGSDAPNRMVQLTYEPAGGKPVAHVALIGKGVTFDSGGLSLKNETAMEHMKSDMTGAAVVLACVRGARELKLRVKVTALLMATENMPDGAANRPGDVVRAMNGKTVEITNTDAEGRLALADGLTYAQRLKPDYIIDVSTLTGAQVISLGRLIGAVMGNDESLVQKIVRAGQKSGELMWQLPLHEPYKDLMKSDIADIKNSSGLTEAGSIQGGLFLSEFVDHPRWAHLDVSGPSWQEREWSVYPRASSGFPARCLLTFLSDLN